MNERDARIEDFVPGPVQAPHPRPSRILGSWVWDLDAGTLRASPEIAEAFCVDPDRASQGAPIVDYFPAIHPDDRERFDQDVLDAIETGGEFFCEYRVRDRRGVTRSLWDRGHCIETSDGKPLRYLGVVLDVTNDRLASLDAIADHLMAASMIAQAAREPMLRHFINMALYELADRLAKQRVSGGA